MLEAVVFDLIGDSGRILLDESGDGLKGHAGIEGMFDHISALKI